MRATIDTLSEKEKETLRLMLRGYDAKSMAQALGLSVHTVNERLRNARRKLEVSSSKEAARLLADHDASDPQILADKQIGAVIADQNKDFPDRPANPASGRSGLISQKAFWIGAIVMSFILATLAALVWTGGSGADQAQDTQAMEETQRDSEREAAALAWLAFVDASDWQASYDAAGLAFQKPNTVATWQAASEAARIPLGAVKERETVAFDIVAAPPSGYEIVRFRTDFAARDGVIETVTLERESGGLKVVGYWIQ